MGGSTSAIVGLRNALFISHRQAAYRIHRGILGQTEPEIIHWLTHGLTWWHGAVLRWKRMLWRGPQSCTA